MNPTKRNCQNRTLGMLNHPSVPSNLSHFHQPQIQEPGTSCSQATKWHVLGHRAAHLLAHLQVRHGDARLHHFGAVQGHLQDLRGRIHSGHDQPGHLMVLLQKSVQQWTPPSQIQRNYSVLWHIVWWYCIFLCQLPDVGNLRIDGPRGRSATLDLRPFEWSKSFARIEE